MPNQILMQGQQKANKVNLSWRSRR